VVNTCSFIEPAQKESVDAILENGGAQEIRLRRKKLIRRRPAWWNGIATRILETDSRGGCRCRPPLKSSASSKPSRGDLKVLPAQPPRHFSIHHDLDAADSSPHAEASGPYIKNRPKAAITPARSALFPQLRGNSAAAGLNRGGARSGEPGPHRAAREVTADRPRHHLLWRRPRLARWPRANSSSAWAQVEEPAVGFRFLYAYPNRVNPKQMLETPCGARTPGEIHWIWPLQTCPAATCLAAHEARIARRCPS